MADIAVLVVGFLLGDILYFFRAGARLEGWFTRLANRRSLAVAICAAVSMVPRLLLLRSLPMPDPAIVDEFSYVLGAQTLALGRLTNPTPPFWQHFENFHINLIPTYQSMYQPAPTAFYALGIVLGHNPWWGVWLATGLMSACFCWALQPIVRPRWAFVAGLFVALRFGMYTLYSDSYWGGAVPALGGALTLGAFVRVTSPQRRWWHLVLLVIGVGLLANSRPFEGFAFALPVAVALVIWIVRHRAWLRVALPVAAMLAIVFAFMAYYNWRGTGNPAQMPYMANFEQYHFVRPFIGTGIKPYPHYNHYEIAKLFIDWEGKPGKLAQHFSGIVYLTKNKYFFYYVFVFAPLMILALVGLWFSWRSRRRAILVWTFVVVIGALFAVVYWPLVSYPAPLLVSFFGLAMVGLRWLRKVELNRHAVGFYWARGVAITLLVFGLVTMYDNARRGIHAHLQYPLPWNEERVRVINQLEREGGKHLIMVKYFPTDHVTYKDWVFNTPEIQKQRVIFARVMDDQQDCAFINYYGPGRRVWLLEPDNRDPWTILTDWRTSPVSPKCQQ